MHLGSNLKKKREKKRIVFHLVGYKREMKACYSGLKCIIWSLFLLPIAQAKIDNDMVEKKVRE